MKSLRILLAVAVLGFGIQPAQAASDPTPTSTPTSTPAPTPSVPPVPNQPHTCSIRAAMNSKDLAYFYGYVMNATTGQVYADVRGQQQTPSASVMKSLTAAAAIQVLTPTYQATTRVYSVPSEPGTVVIRGGGDHTLSRLDPPSYTTYKYPAKISKLAAQVLASWPTGQPITKIILDGRYFDQPAWNTAWSNWDRTSGNISLITGLMVDSDRANPDLTDTHYDGTRSTDPVMKAGKYFKQALGVAASGATLVEAVTPGDAVEIGNVKSQPMSIWLDHALKYSDNTETEVIAKHAERMSGMITDFKGVQPMVQRALRAIGIDSTGLVMNDASGLAQSDRVTAKLVASVMAEASHPTSAISSLIGYLPVSGVSGTLSGRYNGYSALARGAVHAKSGYIPGVFSLAGLVYAKDGTVIAFAGFARQFGGKKLWAAAKPALDALTTRLFLCGAGSYY